MTNVLLVVADDMRADLLEFMPFLNGVLRREGTIFPNLRCSIPLCNPARAGLLTGQYARGPANGIYANTSSSLGDPTRHTLPNWITAATKGMFGKYLVGKGSVKQPGWDTWTALSANEQEAMGYTVSDGTTATQPAEHQLTYLADRVSTFVTTTPEPWFCYYAPTNPHINVSELANNPLASSISLYSWLRWPLDLLTDVATKPSWVATRPQLTKEDQSLLRRNIRQQVREVHDLDGVLARLYADLQTVGRLDRTVIIFVTDSGVFYGEQRLGSIFTSGKNYPYDVVAKVPCVLRGPTIPAATVARTPAVLQDVTATILALFGAAPTVSLDGIDLRQLIATPDPLRATLYQRAADTEAPAGAGVVTATRKLTRWTATSPADRYEAYDLDVDPAERRSWAGDPGRAAELATLEAQLDALLSRTYEPLPV